MIPKVNNIYVNIYDLVIKQSKNTIRIGISIPVLPFIMIYFYVQRQYTLSTSYQQRNPIPCRK